MATQDKVIRWWNGNHQDEHEFLAGLQKHIKQNQEDPQIALKDLQVFIKQRQAVLVDDNKFDISPYLSYILGATAGLGLGLFLLSESAYDFGLWMVFLSLFHLWEYTYVALFHVETLSSNCKSNYDFINFIEFESSTYVPKGSNKSQSNAKIILVLLYNIFI
jgi:hypothetical protein